MHGQLTQRARSNDATRLEHTTVAEPAPRESPVALFDRVGDHLIDANDALGQRASGMWMSVAARDLDMALAGLRSTGMVLPMALRPAVRALVVAPRELRGHADRMRGLVPPSAEELPAIDLQLCRWTDAVRQLAAWLDGTCDLP